MDGSWWRSRFSRATAVIKMPILRHPWQLFISSPRWERRVEEALIIFVYFSRESIRVNEWKLIFIANSPHTCRYEKLFFVHKLLFAGAGRIIECRCGGGWSECDFSNLEIAIGKGTRNQNRAISDDTRETNRFSTRLAALPLLSISIRICLQFMVKLCGKMQ